MTKYKWECPHDWLKDYASEMDKEQLRELVEELALRLDDDTLQDMYERIMNLTGYFDEEDDDGNDRT